MKLANAYSQPMDFPLYWLKALTINWRKSIFSTRTRNETWHQKFGTPLLTSFGVSFFILIINRRIRAKTLESNEASFIVQEMIPAYRAAVTSQGTSSKGRRTRRENEIITLTNKRP